MGVEVQRCSDCGWVGDGENPRIRECPNCGAYYYETYRVQWFGGHAPGYEP